MRSAHEFEAAVQRERDAAEREPAQAELLRQGAQRREAERRQEQLEWHEEAQKRVDAEKRKGAEQLRRYNAKTPQQRSGGPLQKRPPPSRAWIYGP